MTHSRPEIKKLLEENALNPSRALGQNFVSDPNTVRRIVRLANITDKDFVVEIGPGLGSLTLAIAETGAKICLVEIDKYIIPVLNNVLVSSNITAEVINEDALKLNWNELLQQRMPKEAAGAYVVANLPYNVGTHIIMHILEHADLVNKLFVMVQKEVAERIVAKVGTKAYGALSVKVACFATAKIAGIVPPTVFVPKPDVDSALVSIVRQDNIPVGLNKELLFKLVNAGFGQRRKMLRRSLAGFVQEADFERAEILSTARAEELALAEWVRLTHSLQST